MLLYEYRCAECGPFDHRRESRHASDPLPCPECATPARRVFTPPGTRSRSGPLGGVSSVEQSRVDRALTGEPTITSAPRGRRLPSRGHSH